MSKQEITLGAIPVRTLFWKTWDGVVNGEQVYVPRKTYYKREDGMLVEAGEFGRPWKASDCGLTLDSLVSTRFQPI
jgi:hypothetical protein